MSYQPQSMHEFSVTYAHFESHMFKGYEGNFVECLNLKIDVASSDPSDFNRDVRKLTGEISFDGRDDPLHDVVPNHGTGDFPLQNDFQQRSN
jgi:hypothetical protein